MKLVKDTLGQDCKHGHNYRISWPRADNVWMGFNYIVCTSCSVSTKVPSTWVLADTTS